MIHEFTPSLDARTAEILIALEGNSVFAAHVGERANAALAPVSRNGVLRPSLIVYFDTTQHN
jgi:hypothetical protein